MIKFYHVIAVVIVVFGINFSFADDQGAAQVPAQILAEIVESYQSTVEPIFRKSCLDCHGQAQHLPWYFSIPGPKQLIEHDIKEAKENIDMTKGFPFKGKASVKELTTSIQDVIEDNSMPPFRYRLLHWNSKMTDAEKKIILKWISETEKRLD